MLFYEKLDPFVVRTENFLESFKRFIKRHFSRAAHQIVCIGNDLLFRCLRYIFFARQSKPFGLNRGNACSDMAFDNQDKLARKTELLRDCNACHRMFDAMRPGPADIMEQSALPDQFLVNGYDHALCNRKRFD